MKKLKALIDKNHTREGLKKAKKLMSELETRAYASHSLNYQEANQIINDFGRIMVFLSESLLFPVYKPNSLLPREKEIMLEAIAVCFKNSIPDSVDRQTLYFAYMRVKEEFKNDKLALEKNHFLVTNSKYWRGMNKK